MKKIWFIRHGESLVNKGLVVPDITAVELSELGHEQAKKLSLEFISAPDLIVATPFLRTQQTSEPTRKIFPSTPYEIWPLQEFTYFSPKYAEGTTMDERAAMRKIYWDRNDIDYIYGDGAESFNACMDRIEKGFDMLRNRDEKFIAIFTHGIILKIIILHLLRPEYSRERLLASINTELTELDVKNCQIVPVSLNDGAFKLEGNFA